MKKILLSALLLAAATLPAADAQFHKPTPNSNYVCTYTNPTMQEDSPGISIFHLTSYYGGTLLRGIEDYEATHQWNWDNRKVSFSEPLDIPRPSDPEVINATRWSFSIDPGGPTCTVMVRNFGKSLSFTGCSDGSSRSCTRVW